jgi:hypothetical protein
MNLKKLLTLTTALVFAAGASVAFADDEPVPPPDPNAGGGGMGMDGTATAGASATGWSKEIINRPLLLPAGKLGAYGNLYILRLSLTNMMTGMTTTTTSEGLQVGAGYGITDKITAGANYAFALHDFEIKGPLTLYGNFDIMHDAKLSVAASGGVVIALSDKTTEAIQAGLGVRYLVAPNIAVFTGGGSFPGAAIPFGDAYGPLAGSQLGGHLQIGLNDPMPISFDIPVGAAYQATPELYVSLSTSLGRIAIKDAGDSAFFGADYIPVNLGALFNVTPNIDAGAFLLIPDMKEIQFDLMFIGLGARYYD